MRRRVTVHTRHQLKQASKHHKQKRASLVATEAIVIHNPRTIVVVLEGTVGAPRVMAGVFLAPRRSGRETNTISGVLGPNAESIVGPNA
jgi:hypothetical protein